MDVDINRDLIQMLFNYQVISDEIILVSFQIIMVLQITTYYYFADMDFERNQVMINVALQTEKSSISYSNLRLSQLL